jgi:hypothetical protein
MVPDSIRGLHEVSQGIEAERQSIFQKSGALDAFKSTVGGITEQTGLDVRAAFGTLGRPKPISPNIHTAKPPF